MPGTGGASLSSHQGQEPGRSLPSQSLTHQEEQEGPGGKKPAQVMLRPDSRPKGLVPVVSLLLTISCCNSHQRSHTEAQRSRVSLNDGTEDAQRSQQHRAGGGAQSPQGSKDVRSLPTRQPTRSPPERRAPSRPRARQPQPRHLPVPQLPAQLPLPCQPPSSVKLRSQAACSGQVPHHSRHSE